MFPKNFTWGAAAASYQIEGAWDKDGKGLSVWDMYVRQPGRIWERNTGDVACDHYHRYKEDISLMRELDLDAYRLSLSWPRILPDGVGAPNEKGLDFYDRLIDTLLAEGIEPWVTLFHWDYPYELFLRGGWLNPDSPKWFADYTSVVVERLSDRVSHWIPMNEPQCFIILGYLTGAQAPGLVLGLREALMAAHQSLIGHGLSVQAIRAQARLVPQIGTATVGTVFYPASDETADREAAMKEMAAVHAGDLWNNTWWNDPLIFGRYPEEGLKAYADVLPDFPDSDFATIKQPLDFMGTNIYRGFPVKAATPGESPSFPPGYAQSLLLWKMTPESLYWGPKFFAERYKLPVVITENGTSGTDWVGLDGKVHDVYRIDFLDRYLSSLRNAIRDGVDVRGYFHWSILDNFEWQEGYKHRLGFIHVDYETQQRTLKDSALWYRDVIASNGRNLLAS